MASAFIIKQENLRDSLKSMVTISYKGASMNVVALWDTGATGSCIAMDVVEQLKLERMGFQKMRTPSGTRDAGIYQVDVLLPNHVLIESLIVCDSEIGEQGIGLLIGMDIIKRGDFAVSNYGGKTAFSFRLPSEGILDFVAGIRFANIMGASRNVRKKNQKNIQKKRKS